MKLTVLLILFWGFGLCASAQNFYYKYYNEEEGISNAYIKNLLVDKEGFLWIATSSGLNRFDGNAFEKFYNTPSDPSSIADNNTQKIYLDHDGRLWIGTNAGISLYHPQTKSFSNYAPDTMILQQQGVSFSALEEDNKHNIWVGTKNDLLIFDPVSGKFKSSKWASYAAKTAPVNSNHLRVIVLGLAKKSEAEIWVLSTYGLFSVNTVTGTFNYFYNPQVIDYFGYQIDYIDQKGNVWISTYGNGILCFDPQLKIWTNYHSPINIVNSNFTSSITQYAGDTLMYCSGNKVLLFDAVNRKIVSQLDYYDTTDKKQFDNLKGNTLIRYQQMIWLGTTKGMYKISAINSSFHFMALTGKDEVDRVYQLADPDLVLYTSFQEKYTTFIKRKDRAAEPVLDPANNPIHIRYQYFTEGADGSCYLNDDDHFYTYNSKINKATAVDLPPKINPRNPFSIKNMVIDREGTVWIRTVEQGILKYNSTTHQLTTATNLPQHAEKELNAMYYDSLSHSLWYAEEFNGVYVYDIAKKQATHYGLNKPPSQRNAAIIYISGDNLGNVWMSDLEAGIVSYDHKLNKFIRITTTDGLLSNDCWWTVYDNQGGLWISTDKGLCKYLPVTKKFVNYTQFEGYPGSPEVFLSGDKAGNIYMPYKNGYYTWNSRAVSDPIRNGKLYLRDVQLFNAHLPADTSFTFTYRDNNIQFLFGLLSFDDRNSITLEYSLNDGAWVNTDLHTYISFANLSPGKYKLAVRLKNETIGELQIHFIIEKPFWLKWWFILLMLVIFFIGTFVMVRYRIQQFRKDSQMNQKIMESEMSALRSQMNPHFIFNTLNSINSYIIENKKDEASDYLTDFSRLMRIILEHSQKRSVTLSEELNALKLYLELESRRLEATFDYSITVDPDVDTTAIFIPSLIIQPFVENSIWHGLRGKKNGGSIEIVVKKYAEGILIVVQDDGVGRNAAGKVEKLTGSNSFGSAATIQRILLNDTRSRIEIEDLYDKTGNALGTRVNIFLYHNFS